MAVETRDWRAARALMDVAKVTECCTAPPEAPAWMREPDAVPYLCLGLPAEPTAESPFRVLASGWPDLEGVMVLAPENDFPADLRVGLVARSERALRDLLLAFPAGATGLFYYSAPWGLGVLSELLEGQPLPSREGYYAAPDTLAPVRSRPVRRLTEDDHAVLDAHWSPEVWSEVEADGYAVFAAEEHGALQAFCFHWPAGPGRREVHGLQGVRDWSAGYAESVFSAATLDVLARGETATCTVNLAGLAGSQVPLRIGYRRFYQVRQFLGIKRGTGSFRRVQTEAFFFGPARESGAGDDPPRPSGPRPAQAADVALIRALAKPDGRRRHGLFVADGLTLVQRAVQDGLPVECVVYTGQSERRPEGLTLLESVWRAGIAHYRVSDGVMGTLTAARPLPAVLAVVHARVGEARDLHLHPGGVWMVAENLQNPDNLGMVLRTADAMGADAVVVAGVDPLRRECVRAARGAVGRIPLRRCDDLPSWFAGLRREGVRVIGATPHGAEPAHRLALQAPLAIAVGNEGVGLAPRTLDACTDRVRIPMAPGQDSLNVGVAAGMLLYEAARRRLAGGPEGARARE